MKWSMSVLACALGFLPLWAQEKSQPPEDPAHNELRDLKREIDDAWNKRDIDRLLSYLHKDVVVTWQNAEVSTGHEQVRAYYNRMMNGPNSVVASVQINLEVAELAHLHGTNTAVAWGRLNDRYL